MTNPSDPVQLQSAFMESSLNKSFHRDNQALFESIYPSKPVTFSSDVLNPTVPFPLAADEITIDTWITGNPGILRKYTDWVLTPDPISNGQLYYIVDVSWQKPFVLEYMVSDPVTNQPSNGYVLKLRQGAGGTVPGQQISPTLGRWWVSPYEGGIHFEVGYTPADMGWGAITATVYVYIGDTVSDVIGGVTGAAPILYGEGPPFDIVPTGNPQLYIDTVDYTGNPLYYNMWAWVNQTLRLFGWRNVSESWKSHYNHCTVSMPESYDVDFTKGNSEQVSAIESIMADFLKALSEQVNMTEIVDIGLAKSSSHQVSMSEDIIITLINGPTSVINGSEINSAALNG